MLKRMVLIVMAGVLCMGCTGLSRTNTKSIAPQGEYATINVEESTRLFKKLLASSASTRSKTAEIVLERPQSVNPPVLYALASELFKQGKKDEAAFWYYAGQIRARFDANRCADASARQAVNVLSQEFGTPINKYAFLEMSRPALEATIKRALAWEAETPRDYDHRWINLHGLGSMSAAFGLKEMAERPLSLPESEWPEIARKTHEEYWQGYLEALEMLDKYNAEKKAAS